MYTLLIEDDEDYAAIVALALRRGGHEVLHFEEAAPAVRYAAKVPPRLAILDIALPDGSGLDACAGLRAVAPGIAVVFLSALDRNADVVAGLEIDGDDYITKPFDPRELRARVNAVLRRAPMSQGTNPALNYVPRVNLGEPARQPAPIG